MNHPINKNCKYCGHEFEALNLQQNYCSLLCKETCQTETLIRDLLFGEKSGLEEKTKTTEAFSELADKAMIKRMNEEIKRLSCIQDYWTFCHATFWLDQNFTEEEQNHFRYLIGRHFESPINSETTFIELVERAIALKLYFNRNRESKIPQPEEWLSGNKYNNLRCSKFWHMDFLHKLSPNARSVVSVKLLAEAFFRFVQSGNVLEVTGIRALLIKNKQPELLQLLINAVFHYQYVHY